MNISMMLWKLRARICKRSLWSFTINSLIYSDDSQPAVFQKRNVVICLQGVIDCLHSTFIRFSHTKILIILKKSPPHSNIDQLKKISNKLQKIKDIIELNFYYYYYCYGSLVLVKILNFENETPIKKYIRVFRFHEYKSDVYPRILNKSSI
ncbi:hypothetical protein PHYBLDRAFT_65021 [Phycomyces blakesleeanus NRRL 1555(-)]|uniref:Uncharacterized protein n=1 Tax=Phycomyces blakesleeanus (strain ATCC 8743b / DSM 1359 / FGSC 10004 / NBRC 33097 / NRRL 1555) TaxID=763407 RepID=A0A163DRY1_PHYB8|nr:hypothetical protein PHYBLDRAFT_65021 [Phycomyces blakesleeanus NRRL 1555(-)]OAD73050.1 hypothetical protein PHYBLDRAFT_65021 [Phycomyces blakesleeanus NRRL 1555(-)]|eukprot:XP_018291090.1 hypothetical protein PHYBLDRAFT_65021 [Phycomyces blakesleeanus NRRL 1555(-)]